MSFSNSSMVPIELLPGLGWRTAKALQRLDIRTVGQFKRAPEKMLVALFGPSIKPLHSFVKNNGPVARKVVRKESTKKLVRQSTQKVITHAKPFQWSNYALKSAKVAALSLLLVVR